MALLKELIEEFSLKDLFRFCGANITYGNKFNNWIKGKDFHHPITHNKINIDNKVWPEKTEEEALADLKIEIDANRFEQELIFYLEKFDITEEKVRLRNHLDYFKTIMKSKEPVGKKLGFVAQEIGREINTIGSKANHSELQKIVVQMKDELEKIKEQLLNVL